MIRVRQIIVPVDASIDYIKNKCADKLNIKVEDILSIKIKKQSLDARKKPKLSYVYEVDIEVNNEDKIIKSNDVIDSPNEEYNFIITGTKKLNYRPIIVGSGPAGLYCAYMLALNGYKPIVIERGSDVDSRVRDVEEFWKTGVLNTNSNVQFGEGGAGTFSDGKLNTLVKDPEHRGKKVLELFVEAGANPDILYVNKPHIGTDVLRDVVKNMRNKIISMGGKFRYNTCLTDIKMDEEIKAIEVNNNEWINTDVLVLAIGHSARDTFEMLYDKKISMEAKPFSIGVRVEHSQKMINKSQYGTDNTNLPAASYKLTYKASNGRGVYTFCMCPGGYVVNASSEEGMLAINGMSNRARESANANSAVVVTVSPDDFGTNPLDGVKFQRELEKKTYELGNGKIPVQLFKDFVDNKTSTEFKSVKPIFKGNYSLCNLNDIFPLFISESLKEGITNFDRKIKGYASSDIILAAIESRTSSPIRINRDEYFMSNVKGIFPCGEGAGYAGGITSAAMDGIKVFEAVASIYKNML